MYSVNKLAWVLLNPAMVGLMMVLVGILLRKFRFFRLLVIIGALWPYLWSMPLMTDVLGRNLEKDYVVYTTSGEIRMREVSEYAVSDAIVDLGGSTGANTNFYSGVALNSSADRVYFSALLWKAGKAPIVIPSGEGCTYSDGRFLKDLGVPESAIVIDDKARNTEENAKYVAKMLAELNLPHKPRILLVTSAWHMKRSLLMFEKYAPEIEVIPAPCDFECMHGAVPELRWGMLLPSFEAAGFNSVYFHEWLGYWWYKYVRK